MTTINNILVLNGPNLNLLGMREPEIYGTLKLPELMADLEDTASQHNLKLSHFQSNSEAELINIIHEAMGIVSYIIINPAAYTHTSVALRDALLGVNIPFYEVHISNVHAREAFRHHSYLSDVAQGVICGFGTDGYKYALDKVIIELINK